MTEPAWKRLRRQANLDRLREQIGNELSEGTDEDFPYGRPVGEQSAESFPDVSNADPRPDHRVCAFCQRAGRRLQPAEGGYPLCRCCAGQQQDDPHAAVYWTSLPRRVRRARIIARFGIDPVDWQTSRFRLRRTTFHDDADGIPALAVTQDAQHVRFVGMPRMFWDVFTERGAGIATAPKHG